LEQAIEINGMLYSHIVDPATGLGLTERIQVTIIGPNATTTDGLATVVSVLGKDRGLRLVDSMPQTSALVATKKDSGYRSWPSRSFPAVSRSF
jgi:thiamine biosynthesis lipoprotein